VRSAIPEGVKNGASKLLGACARIAKEMGYNNIITYTLMSESGVSLKAAGWQMDEENVGGKNRHWNSSGQMIRSAVVGNLFEESVKYPDEPKRRWIKILNTYVEKKAEILNVEVKKPPIEPNDERTASQLGCHEKQKLD
jgi:hypothetical protein